MKRGRGARQARAKIDRILVGVRLEQRLVKVMKGLAELKNYTLGELIEEIVLQSLDGQSSFADRDGKMTPEMKSIIRSLKQVYGLEYRLEDIQTAPKVTEPASQKGE